MYHVSIKARQKELIHLLLYKITPTFIQQSIIGAARKVLQRKVQTREILLLENPITPHHIRPTLTKPLYPELCSQCQVGCQDHSKPFFKIRAFFVRTFLVAPCKCLSSNGSSHVGLTSFHGNTEVKQHWAGSVLGNSCHCFKILRLLGSKRTLSNKHIVGLNSAANTNVYKKIIMSATIAGLNRFAVN